MKIDRHMNSLYSQLTVKTQFILQYSFYLIGDGDLNVGNVLHFLSS